MDQHSMDPHTMDGPPTAPPINNAIILADMQITLQFFRTQMIIFTAQGNEAMICKLFFVLQSILDYHASAEMEFATIDAEQWDFVQGSYSTFLASIHIDDAICKSLPHGREFTDRHTLQDVHYAIDDEQLLQNNQAFQIEPALGTVITNWVEFYVKDYSSSPEDNPPTDILKQFYGPEYQSTPHKAHIDFWTSGAIVAHEDGQRFKTFKMMKVFILQHAMSLASHGRGSRDGWRSAAANSMIGLNHERFIVCEAIMLSLFLRRQNAIENEDVDDHQARLALNQLKPSELWRYSAFSNDEETPIKKHLTQMFQPGNYPAQFRFPRTLSLYDKVSINFQIFVNDAVSYVNHFQNRTIAGAGVTFFHWINWWIRTIWDQVKDPLDASQLYKWRVDQLLNSERWDLESEWWIKPKPRKYKGRRDNLDY
jgi:hypothetical protein